MVVALVVTTKGDKVFLGFVQTDTENAVVIRSFLRSLKDRGIDLSARSAGGDRWSPRSPERASWRSSRDRCSSSGASGTSGRT